MTMINNPLGWHPRGSTKPYRSNITLPLIKMSEAAGGPSEADTSDSHEYYIGEKFDQMEVNLLVVSLSILVSLAAVCSCC